MEENNPLNFAKLLVGSCNCLTTLSEAKYHDRFCYYRLLLEKTPERERFEETRLREFAADLRNKLSPILTLVQLLEMSFDASIKSAMVIERAKESISDMIKIIKKMESAIS